ncbi:AAA family ATPase [Micromonospora sp. NPDC048930]|uniref:AAA family ATPase n=1 Tax=Micromonospora sp. NPDC048930 TaxID=3364261 RepID=UPI00371F5293
MGRQVVLVCGPPCAGKNTYAAARARPGDLVVDSDDLARRLGSPRRWHHEDRYWQAAQEHWWQLAAAVGRDPAARAWVIRCAASAAERQRIADLVDATAVVVLVPPAATLMRRAAARPHRSRTRALIVRWLAGYRPRAGDQVLTEEVPACG